MPRLTDRLLQFTTADVCVFDSKFASQIFWSSSFNYVSPQFLTSLPTSSGMVTRAAFPVWHTFRKCGRVWKIIPVLLPTSSHVRRMRSSVVCSDYGTHVSSPKIKVFDSPRDPFCIETFSKPLETDVKQLSWQQERVLLNRWFFAQNGHLTFRLREMRLYYQYFLIR